MAKFNIENSFTYHPPFGTQPQRYQAIRDMAKAFAKLIQDNSPASGEQTLAFRALEEVVMRANQAIANNEVELPEKAEPATQFVSAAGDATGTIDQREGVAAPF